MVNKVVTYYRDRVKREWNRLDRYRMEFDMTKMIFKQYMPSAPKLVCDIGGGPGRYSFMLSEQGYNVTLVDICLENLDFAQNISGKKKNKLHGIVHANATDLSMLPSNYYDVVLLMGPMYHLINEKDRTMAIKECKRIIRDNGLLFVSFITPFERLRFLSHVDPKLILKYSDRIEELLKHKVQIDPMEIHGNKSSFTESYYFYPSEIVPFLEKNGIKTVNLHGLEVITGKPYEKVSDYSGSVWEQWLEINYKLSTNNNLLGSADHLLYVGRKT